jgi:hypothetical protein
MSQLHDDEIPYFSWDRPLTVRQIKEQLRAGAGFERVRLAAWIIREAAFADVWQFLTPEEVWRGFAEVEPLLGRRRAFWKYILNTWHELGKV